MASTWAGLASNETISFNNLQNGVDTGQFTAKTTIPVSDEQITKADANTYVNIDTAYAPYAAKANNQLVVKSNLITTTTTTTTTTAAATTTTTLASYAYDFDSTGYGDASNACAFYTNNFTVYADTGAGGSVTRFFTNAGLSTPFSGNGVSYYAWSIDGGLSIFNGIIDNNGFTSSVTMCP